MQNIVSAGKSCIRYVLQLKYKIMKIEIKKTVTDFISKKNYLLKANIIDITESRPVNDEHCYEVTVEFNSEKYGKGYILMFIRMKDLCYVCSTSVKNKTYYGGRDEDEIMPELQKILKKDESAPVSSREIWELLDNELLQATSVEVSNEKMKIPEDKSDGANDLIYGENNW